MAETRTRLTAEDLLRLPDNGMRRELVAGELIEMSPASPRHGLVANRLAAPLSVFVDEHDLGEVFAAETGFRLARDPDTVRAPDVTFISKDRLSQADVDGFPDLAPDLVVEVVSPGDSANEIQAKVDEWLRAGTRLVVVLYPAHRSAVVHRTDGASQRYQAGDTLTLEPVVPGFSLALERLFRRR